MRPNLLQRPTMMMALTRPIALVLAAVAIAHATPTQLVQQAPARISAVAPGVFLVDFGRVAFGNLRVTPPAGARTIVTFNFGEALKDGRIDRNPPGTVRYAHAVAELAAPGPVVVAPPADARNTRQLTAAEAQAFATNRGNAVTPPAILTPSEWGVVLPFRWVEVEGWPGELEPGQLTRQAAFASTWDDAAAEFSCSDEMLNRVWELCRYSIKATSFAGVYVDGDRERIPYEADAYLNQLSHYATGTDIRMARDTFDHLMRYPTWPTEWATHLIFMAHADWWRTGDKAWLAEHYDALKPKLLLDRVAPDGLITSNAAQRKMGDLVDWPGHERDGFVFTSVNAVVNAFYLHGLERMAELATALGRADDAADYRERYRVGRAAFQAAFFDREQGRYRDGVGTEHASLHANLFAVAFDLVPEEQQPAVMSWLRTRGMDCSVYAAQYYLDALFQHGADARAVELMVAPGDRSWRHMVESGTTITWEAWDQTYKPNQDWNHAWGAAPANLLPRFILGVSAAVPGWGKVRISPVTGGLSAARGIVPTPRGPITVAWTRGQTFHLELTLPPGVHATVELPAKPGSATVVSQGKSIPARRTGDRWHLPGDYTGHVVLDVR